MSDLSDLGYRLGSPRYYILVDGIETPEPDILKWARWFEDSKERVIGKTGIGGGVLISTVFLGLDHQFGQGPPLIYETMIFGGPQDEEQWRYTTRAQALAGHEAAVALAREWTRLDRRMAYLFVRYWRRLLRAPAALADRLMRLLGR